MKSIGKFGGQNKCPHLANDNKIALYKKIMCENLRILPSWVLPAHGTQALEIISKLKNYKAHLLVQTKILNYLRTSLIFRPKNM